VLKFCTYDYGDKEAAQHELQVGRRIAGLNLSHDGILYLQTVIEGFDNGNWHSPEAHFMAELNKPADVDDYVM
jgi:hypothetical protein